MWKGAVIAECETCPVLEGNVYFPPDSVRAEHLRASATHTVCSWKGTASYYDVVVGTESLTDGAWYYPDPKSAAAEIKDHIAFWRGVVIETAR